jgi:hypothetical protein
MMTLAQLKQTIDTNTKGGVVSIDQKMIGDNAVASFILTLTNKSLTLSSAKTVITDNGISKTLNVNGTLSDTWTLTSFANTALKQVTLILSFNQTTDNDPIISNLTCSATIELKAGISFLIKGSLSVSNAIAFNLADVNTPIFPLLTLIGFTGSVGLQNCIPPIDAFANGSISNLNMLCGFAKTSPSALSLTIKLNSTWAISSSITVSGIVLNTSVNYTPLPNGKIQKSFSGYVSGITHIGTNDFAIKIGLQESTQWNLEVIPKDGNILPGMADVCALTGVSILWDTVQSGLNTLKLSAISVDGVKVCFDYSTKKISLFQLKSHITIAGVQFNIQTQLPNFQFSGALADNNKISLKAIIQNYFGAADSFPEADITAMSVFTNPGNKSYALSLTITDNWAYPLVNGKSLALKEVSTNIEYTSAGTAGGLTTTFDIAGTSVILSAAYQAGADAGWQFEGNSFNDTPIPIGTVFIDLGNYFGITLPQAINKVTINNISLKFNTGKKDFSFNFIGQIPLFGNTADITFNSAITNVDNSYTKKIDGTLTVNKNDFSFTLSSDDAATTIALSYKGNITLADIATGFTFGQVAIPKTLERFVFNTLSATVDTAANQKTFDGSGTILINDSTTVVLALSIKQKSANISFSGTFVLTIDGLKPATCAVAFVKKDAGYDLNLSLNFTVAGIQVVLNANVTSAEADEVKTTNKSFNGGTKGLNLKVSDLLADLMQNIFPDYNTVIPADFLPNFTINDIFISYDGKTGEVTLLASTTAVGKAVKFFFNYVPKLKSDPASKSSYAFGIETDIASLGGLPLVGEQLKEVKFTNAGFVYTSAESKFAIPALSTASTPVLIFEEAKTYQSGFNLIGELVMGYNLDPLSILLPLVSSNTGGVKATVLAATKPTPTFQAGVKWININKSIGPVKLKKVGFAYSTTDQKLALLLNAELAMSGITFSVEGLGLAFLPASLFKGTNIEPEFRLSGLGLAISKGPLNISGMFVKVDPGKDEDLAFYGAAEISTAKFGISGIGAYSQGKKGVSFFIYAMYNGPIGGPSFFFVTGIAAGFGYNRSVRLPEVQQVQNFPLVSMALSGDDSKTILDVLSDLIDGDWIPTSYGDYWLAVGIKFTTFKIVDSFVLLVVEFGTKLQFAIMGLSLLKWPNTGSAIVYVELAVLARFGTDSDVISVQAVLTTNSYVFDRNCKLTGGFAFFTWISGPHEGDFVITLGGYHPRYPVPDYYPKVDRLGLNWKIGSIVTMTGEMYFALTPNAIMAGGLWQVVCDLSFLKASVTVYADVLISWAPFYYQIDGGITVRIEADIKILFINVHFKLSMGAEIHIWGPPFAGEIYVDWTIFSFTIPFGSNDKNPPEALKWDEFATKFIPQKDNADHPLDTRIAAGIIDTIQDDQGKPIGTIIDPYNFSVSVDSFFPVKELYKDAANTQPLTSNTWMDIAGQNTPAYLADQNDQFGIKPMDVAQVSTQLNTGLFRKNTAGQDEPVTDNIAFVASAKGMVGALWGNQASAGAVIKNVPAGLQLHTTEPVDQTIISVNLSDYNVKTLGLPINFLQNTDAYGQLQPEAIDQLIRTNINNPVQKSIIDNLVALGFDIPTAPTIVYDDLKIETPLYVAAVGQNITEIIKS